MQTLLDKYVAHLAARGKTPGALRVAGGADPSAWLRLLDDAWASPASPRLVSGPAAPATRPIRLLPRAARARPGLAGPSPMKNSAEPSASGSRLNRGVARRKRSTTISAEPIPPRDLGNRRPRTTSASPKNLTIATIRSGPNEPAGAQKHLGPNPPIWRVHGPAARFLATAAASHRVLQMAVVRYESRRNGTSARESLRVPRSHH